MVPRAMHVMRSPYDGPMNDDFSHDGWAIHDPVFHDRLNNTIDHRPFHDGLDDLSFYNATLNWTNDMLFDNPMLDARLVKVIVDLASASSRSIVESVIIIFVEGVATTKLRGSRRGCRNRGARVSECGDAAYSECLRKTS